MTGSESQALVEEELVPTRSWLEETVSQFAIGESDNPIRSGAKTLAGLIRLKYPENKKFKIDGVPDNTFKALAPSVAGILERVAIGDLSISGFDLDMAEGNRNTQFNASNRLMTLLAIKELLIVEEGDTVGRIDLDYLIGRGSVSDLVELKPGKNTDALGKIWIDMDALQAEINRDGNRVAYEALSPPMYRDTRLAPFDSTIDYLEILRKRRDEILEHESAGGMFDYLPEIVKETVKESRQAINLYLLQVAESRRITEEFWEGVESYTDARAKGYYIPADFDSEAERAKRQDPLGRRFYTYEELKLAGELTPGTPDYEELSKPIKLDSPWVWTRALARLPESESGGDEERSVLLRAGRDNVTIDAKTRILENNQERGTATEVIAYFMDRIARVKAVYLGVELSPKSSILQGRLRKEIKEYMDILEKIHKDGLIAPRYMSLRMSPMEVMKGRKRQ